MRTAACLLALCRLAAFAQPPGIQNAQVEKRSAVGGLEAGMRAILAAQSSPAWVGYAVAAVAGDRHMCCYNSGQGFGGCALEGDRTITSAPAAAAPSGPVYLEGPKEYFILYRVDQGRVEKVRSFTPDCAIDAGGLKLLWLADIKPAESIAYLANLARESERRGEGMIAAIALHAAPEAVKTLLDFAQNGSKTHLRSQALFWLAQTATPDVSKTAITAAIDTDPQTEVKRQAVFALSQVPRGEGVPLLIQLARSSKNTTVQKQAMFWLGRSRDERATRFFQEVLGR